MPAIAADRQIDAADFAARKVGSELHFLRQGITFNVYHDERGSERIFPFDPIPRVIAEAEWRQVEAGLQQRIVALNRFLDDVYHDQQILRAPAARAAPSPTMRSARLAGCLPT